MFFERALLTELSNRVSRRLCAPLSHRVTPKHHLRTITFFNFSPFPLSRNDTFDGAFLLSQIPWGFSLSWGRPPRVERVDPGSPAERSGLRPGDHVVFVDATNVVTRSREEILELIQAATNQLILEVYRKGSVHSSMHRPTSMNVSLQQPIGAGQHAVAFNAEVGTGVLV